MEGSKRQDYARYNRAIGHGLAPPGRRGGVAQRSAFSARVALTSGDYL
jgi:hypothetical protein